MYDGDGDGTLSKDEFHAALEAEPISMRFADRERLHRSVPNPKMSEQNDVEEGWWGGV